jgi:hypothetical protein
MTSVDGTGERADARAPGQPPAGPVDFRILTPANWYVLDLNPGTRNSSIARLVEQRFGPVDDPRLVQARREMTALLRGAARDAADNGAVYAALMDALVEGTALSASLLAVVGPAPLDEDGNVITDPGALSATLLASELAAAVDAAIDPAGDGTASGDGTAGGDRAADRDLATSGGSAAVDLGGNGTAGGDGTAAGDDDGTAAGDDRAGRSEIVELPAGPAVRLRRRTDSGLAGTTGQTVPAAETQYFVPIPATDRLLVLTFATPNVGFHAEFDELFDRMAETLRWQWEPVA